MDSGKLIWYLMLHSLEGKFTLKDFKKGLRKEGYCYKKIILQPNLKSERHHLKTQTNNIIHLVY